ncbi:hypothetical protein PoB_000412900 [Plakobranchus ocellatus]|uniref:Uncharacterized protein n=1 Tax=Plakobranchus ocellatus TaxID=259542 RepID=A0AAV3Y3R8_9GAST|nr:hypothetical protein PoB_000412900 [Plakobranchus ocellatus]
MKYFRKCTTKACFKNPPLESQAKRVFFQTLMANRNRQHFSVKNPALSTTSTNSRLPSEAAATPTCHTTTVNLTVVMPQFLPSFPGQMVLAARNEDDLYFSSSDDDYLDDSDDYFEYDRRGLSCLDTNSIHRGKGRNHTSCQIRDDGRTGSKRRRHSAQNIRFFTWKSSNNPSSRKRQTDSANMFDPREIFAFSDMDYVIPQEVRQVLKEEGVDDSTSEAWLKCREVWHRRAEALRFFEMAKYRSSVRLKNDIVRLPPIGIDSKRPGSEDQYSTSPLPIKEATPPEPQPLPEIQRLPKPPVRVEIGGRHWPRQLEDTGRGQLEDTGLNSWKTLVKTAGGSDQNSGKTLVNTARKHRFK